MSGMNAFLHDQGRGFLYRRMKKKPSDASAILLLLIVILCLTVAPFMWREDEKAT